MKRRRVILIAAGCLVAVVVAVLVWPGEREPEYQGKKLSEWIREDPRATATGSVVFDAEFQAKRLKAEEGIRQIGTNALPLLLKWIRSESRRRGSLHGMINRLPGSLPKSEFLHSLARSDGERRADYAILAFMVLRAQAAPAISELAELTKEAQFPKTATYAAIALSWICTNPAPVLVGCLTNEIEGVRLNAANAIRRSKDPATFAETLRFLQSVDKTGRERGEDALRRIAPEVLQTNAVSGR